MRQKTCERTPRAPGRPRAGGRAVLASAAVLAAVLAGCGTGIWFPSQPLRRTAGRADYDFDGDGRAEFFCLFDKSGRIDRIAYDRDRDGKPDDVVPLRAIEPSRCRHLVLALDGIPFDVVREFYDSGHLRIFPPPTPVVPPYPVMTDLALEDAFGYVPCTGYEAKYYDRLRRRVVGGTSDYLAGKNEPFARIIQYRAPTLEDGSAYLNPEPVFREELARVRRLWDRREHMETIAYFVSTAALGSRRGRAGQIQALRECERLMMQVLCESRGLVKFTMLADHGQTDVPCKPAHLERHLRARGWRLAERLRGPRDAVLIRFGLVTVAAFSTLRPAGLAEDLLASDEVTLVSYVEGDAVVVRTRGQKATIRSDDGKTFRYTCLRGDPLRLAGLLDEGASTRPDGRTFRIDGRDLLKLTVRRRHEYPDALYRLWRAHFALVENPADVIVSLDDRFYNGSGLFSGAVSMASTHGGLNRRNSVTFIMSTAGDIPGPLRSEDIPAAVGRLFGRTFPLGR